MAIELFQNHPGAGFAPEQPPLEVPPNAVAGGLIPQVPQQTTFQQLAPAALGLLGTVLGGGNTFARGYAGGMQRATTNRRLQYDQQLRQWQAEQRARQLEAAQDIAEQRLGLERERFEWEQQPQAAAPTSTMREYAAAQAQGFGGSLLDFIQAKRPPGTTINVGSGGGALTQEWSPAEEARMVQAGVNPAEYFPSGKNREPKRYPAPAESVQVTERASQTIADLNPLIEEIESKEGVIDDLRSVKTGVGQALVPSQFSSVWKNPDHQVYDNYAREWIARHLKLESGAAVTDNEFDREYAIYFVMPGDDDATVEVKRRRRSARQKQLSGQGGTSAPTPPPGFVLEPSN